MGGKAARLRTWDHGGKKFSRSLPTQELPIPAGGVKEGLNRIGRTSFGHQGGTKEWTKKISTSE